MPPPETSVTALPVRSARSRSPDPTNAVFGFVGKVVVDHQLEVCNVDAAGCDVRRDEEPAVFPEPVSDGPTTRAASSGSGIVAAESIAALVAMLLSFMGLCFKTVARGIVLLFCGPFSRIPSSLGSTCSAARRSGRAG